MKPSDLSKYDIRVIRALDIAEKELRVIQDLFDLNYKQANHDYLNQSFKKLRFMALAYDRELPIGFALGDAVRTTLPRMIEPQSVILAGICCVSPEYRRQGLFSFLESKAIQESAVLLEPAKRILACGRMAHPASFRVMTRNPTVVPKHNVPPTEWQQEVGLRVAELYDVDLDPQTFVVRGKGSPIGYPKMEIQVNEDEWLPFKAVNRDRGDSLLGISWSPDAPEGW